MIRELKFEMICRLHSDEIYRYVRSLCGNAKDAEDIVQDALLRLWQHVGTVGVLSSRSWLYRTARNLCLDHLRRQNHRAAPTYHATEALAEMLENAGSNDRVDPDGQEISGCIDAALLRLPEIQRSVFVLYEINGLRYREIADHLEIPLNSVKVNLMRARKRLQSLLKDQISWIHA